MKIVAPEEHWMSTGILRAWASLPTDLQNDRRVIFDRYRIAERLEDTGKVRLRHMDEFGLDVQVLSLTVPGVHDRTRDRMMDMPDRELVAHGNWDRLVAARQRTAA